jgi:hypothetical protein
MKTRPYGNVKNAGGTSRTETNRTPAGDIISGITSAARGQKIRALFDHVVRAVRALGSVRILPEKTRIAF